MLATGGEERTGKEATRNVMGHGSVGEAASRGEKSCKKSSA